MLIDTLHNARKNKNNEFYTRYDDVKRIIENSTLIEYFKDKVVYLPCDTELSNIYKYLVDNKDKLGIKEILRTSDDYYSHLDLYKQADIVFTNPPFTGLKAWLKWLMSNDIKFIVWAPTMQVAYSWNDIIRMIVFPLIHGSHTNLYSNTNVVLKDVTSFDTKYGGNGEISCFIVTNDFAIKQASRQLKTSGKSINQLLEENKLYKHLTGYYACNNLWTESVYKYIPDDYYDPIIVSPTYYISYRDNFELLQTDKDNKDLLICADDKRRCRVLVRRIK